MSSVRWGMVGAGLIVLGLVVVLGGCSTGARAQAGSASQAAESQTAASQAAESPNSIDDPVSVYDLADPIVAYQAYVTAQLGVLQDRTAVLAADVAAGDLSVARTDWLAAHAIYHSIGAVYGAFGNTARAVDGLTAGLSGGTADPAFTGFHRVEFELWTVGSTSAAAGPAAALARDVAGLRAKASTFDIPPNTFTTRAHEILENALQFELTGEDDYGSHSDLATVEADLRGTLKIIDLLRPLLHRRAPALLSAIDGALAGAGSTLGTAAAGGPVAVAALPVAVREAVDARIGAALETLAAIPGLLEVQDDD